MSNLFVSTPQQLSEVLRLNSNEVVKIKLEGNKPALKTWLSDPRFSSLTAIITTPCIYHRP